MKDSNGNEIDVAVRFDHVPRGLIEVIKSRLDLVGVFDPQLRARLARSDRQRERLLLDFPDPDLVRLFIEIGPGSDSSTLARILEEVRPSGVTAAVIIDVGLKSAPLYKELPAYVKEHILALRAEVVLKVTILKEC